jgi:hypothetical protein
VHWRDFSVDFYSRYKFSFQNSRWSTVDSSLSLESGNKQEVLVGRWTVREDMRPWPKRAG